MLEERLADMSHLLYSAWNSLIEYETPRLVKIHNRKVGIVRRLIQMGIIMYVVLYALMLQKGYQEFGRVESSVTTKIKGVTRSHLDEDSEDDPALYTRVWDVADYVVPPAENGAFFVATNVIITPNQTRGFCPEDNFDVKGVDCNPDPGACDAAYNAITITDLKRKRLLRRRKRADNYTEAATVASAAAAATVPAVNEEKLFSVTSTVTERLESSSPTPLSGNRFSGGGGGGVAASKPTPTVPENPRLKCRSMNNTCVEDAVLFKAHGPLTGYCIESDRPQRNVPGRGFSCEVNSWCPIEIDALPLGRRRALMAKAEDYTVFVKNSIAFPYFGEQYMRNNLISNGRRPCLYTMKNRDEGCQIFRLGDMVQMAGGNFSKMAIKGGVVSLSIAWHCNLDYDFMSHCLPRYNFRILDDFGWNFRHAKYHEENRRTLYKMYGIKFIITIEGRGGKFNLKNTILNIGSGLALLGVTTVICDFLLMYIKEKRVVKMKKYDYVEPPSSRKRTGKKKRKKSVDFPSCSVDGVLTNGRHDAAAATEATTMTADSSYTQLNTAAGSGAHLGCNGTCSGGGGGGKGGGGGGPIPRDTSMSTQVVVLSPATPTAAEEEEVHPLTMSAQQLPLTPLTLGQRLPENLNDDDGGGGEGETNGFLEDDSVTTGGLNREHYELREGSQIVL